LKVLCLSSLYPNNIWPNHGVFTKERITNLIKLANHQAKVVAPVPYYPPIKFGQRWLFSKVLHKELRDGIEVYHPRYFITPKIGMSLYGLMMFLSILPLIKSIQNNFDFDVIDSHYVYPDGYAAILLGMKLRKPVIVSALGSDINLYAKFPIIRKLLKFTLIKATHIVAVSQALKDSIVNLDIPKEKISVIPTGVDKEKFYPYPKKEARRRLGLPDKRIILSVGHLTPNKGFDLLVGGLKVLIDEYKENEVLLVIVGDGAFRKELEEKINRLDMKDCVLLQGVVPHEELYLWYSAADLFCLASEREGWPNVVLEAMACGIPVVATPVGGIPEILCSDEIGLLTERNESQIAEKIFFGLRKSWKFDKIIDYSRGHNWDRIALATSHVFQKALLAFSWHRDNV